MSRRVRETLAAMTALEMLVEGVHFRSRSIWGLPFNKEPVRRTFGALAESGVIRKQRAKGRYLLTNTFVDAMKEDITRRMPRGVFIHYPDLAVFDICGIEKWTEEEFEVYIKRLREHWSFRRKEAEARKHPGGSGGRQPLVHT